MRDQHHRCVEARERLLEPLQRLDVEVVGGLVQQQQLRAGRQRAGERGARELAAGERVERALQVVLREAQAARHHRRAVAPQVAPQRLQARLRAGVPFERRLGRLTGGPLPRALGVGALPRHQALQPGELSLRGQLLGAAREHVIAQRHPALPRRTLVVQRHAHPLREAQLAAVHGLLPREHPQQRRLARAVATGDRHALAALELERHPAQQRFARDVLVEVGCDQYGHGSHGRWGRV